MDYDYYNRIINCNKVTDYAQTTQCMDLNSVHRSTAVHCSV